MTNNKTLTIFLLLFLTLILLSPNSSAYPVRVVDDISDYTTFGQQFTLLQQAVCMNFVGRCVNEDVGYGACTYNEQTEECFCEYSYYPDNRVDWTQCRPDAEICKTGYADARYCWGGDVYDTYYSGTYPNCQTQASELFTCTYGCENGACTTQECITSAVTESMCRDGHVKQKWQDDNCGTYWKTIDSCASDEFCFEARCVKQDEPTPTLPPQPPDITKTCGAEDGCVLDCVPEDIDCGTAPEPTCDLIATEPCTILNEISCEIEATSGCEAPVEETMGLSQICSTENTCYGGLTCDNGLCKKDPTPTFLFVGGTILILLIAGVSIFRKRKKSGKR